MCNIIHYMLIVSRHASMYEKLFLRALLTELARTGLEEAPLTHITHQLHTLCQVEGELDEGGGAHVYLLRIYNYFIFDFSFSFQNLYNIFML